MQLDYNEILGFIVKDQKTSFHFGLPSEWILDYKMYDKKYDPNKWEYKFRNGLLTVSENNADSFIQFMNERIVSISEIKELISEHGIETIHPVILINFDKKLVVHNNFHLTYDEYMPKGWKGEFDDPIKYLPEEMKFTWQINIKK